MEILICEAFVDITRNLSDNFIRYRYSDDHRDVRLAPAKLEGASIFSDMKIVQNEKQETQLLVLEFESFDADGAQLSIKFRPDGASGTDSLNNLSEVQEKGKALLNTFTFNFTDMLKKILCETSAFEHFSEWAVVSCPPSNQLYKGQAECCLIPCEVSCRYLSFNGKLYPLGLDCRKSQDSLSTIHSAIIRDNHKLCSCQLIQCRYGHNCVPKTFEDEYRCDKCEQEISPESEGLVCDKCHFFVCERCTKESQSVTSRLHLRACFDQCCFQCKVPAPMFSYFCEKCLSCIPPQCVFVDFTFVGRSEHTYPVSVSLKLGDIQRYRAVKFAAFNTIPVGSEVMLSATASSEVFSPQEVLKVVGIENTMHGPEFIVRVADDDLHKCGYTRMQQLPFSSLQQVINGAINENCGVFVKGSRFIAKLSYPRKEIPAAYFDNLIGTVKEKDRILHVEWPLADCLHLFRVSNPRALALEDVGPEKKLKAKYESLLEKLGEFMEEKERCVDGKWLDFFDVLFVGNKCNVFEDPVSLKERPDWDNFPIGTIIRCDSEIIHSSSSQEANLPTYFFKISDERHQICASVSAALRSAKVPRKAESVTHKLVKTPREATGGAAEVTNTSTPRPKGANPKTSASIVLGLKRCDVQLGMEADFDFNSQTVKKDFICEKETPLRLKLKKQTKFEMTYLNIDSVETGKEQNDIPKDEFSSIALHQLLKSSNTIEIDAESEKFKNFDIEIDFCRELGEYFQVKRFIIQHKETKYAVGVVLDVSGHWVEVHSGSFRENNNKVTWDAENYNLACFLQHPLSRIIGKQKRQCIIFSVDALQGKDRFTDKVTVEEAVNAALNAALPKRKTKFNVTSTGNKNFCVCFFSLEDANAFNLSARTHLQIKEVTVGPQDEEAKMEEKMGVKMEVKKWEKQLYFIKLSGSECSNIFSHRTEIQYRDANVPFLEYPVVLPPISNCGKEHTFRLQIVRSHRYAHPVVPGIPESLEADVHFIFYEQLRKKGKIYGKWKYGVVISSSESRADGHLMIQEIDGKNQRGQPRSLKLWLVECENSNCQNNNCAFFHLSPSSFALQQSVPKLHLLDDFCPNWKKCSNLHCGLNHQKPKDVFSSILSFQILPEPLIFPSDKSNIVFLKPNLQGTSEHFSKGFLRPWLPGKVVGIDIDKQVYKVKPVVQKVPETDRVSSSWANENVFAVICDNKVEVHDSTKKLFESPNQVLVLSYAWISFEQQKCTLAYGCEDGSIHLWELTHAKHTETHTLKGHLGSITCISPITSAEMSSDSIQNSLACFATGSADGDVRLWKKSKSHWCSQVCPDY